jgi:hypothetical protein
VNPVGSPTRLLGIVFAHSRDCTEPSPTRWSRPEPSRGSTIGAASGGLLALAPLARESTVLFAAGLAGAALAAGRWRDVGALAATALPAMLWQAYLTATVPAPTIGGIGLLQLPMAGAFPIADLDPGRLAALFLLGLPALALLPGALAWTWREPRVAFGWLIALNILLVLIAPNQSWWHVLGLPASPSARSRCCWHSRRCRPSCAPA